MYCVKDERFTSIIFFFKSRKSSLCVVVQERERERVEFQKFLDFEKNKKDDDDDERISCS